MINHWWVTRPKRLLNTIPEILSVINDILIDQRWTGQTNKQLLFENALEDSNLKKIGARRDQRAGGARTYIAWLKSLGLIFEQEKTGELKFTLAGEAILSGESPVEILTYQILRYQFPSSFSLGNNSRNRVNPRFNIRPFRFLFRLLLDNRIGYLREEEIAYVVIVEAEDETSKCYNNVVKDLLEYRNVGVELFDRIAKKYYSCKDDKIADRLKDVANTIINWVEYTQLAHRDGEKKLIVIKEKRKEIETFLETASPFIDRPEDHEYFQRKYGTTKNRTKDTRNLLTYSPVTERELRESKIRKILFQRSLKKPIVEVTADLINDIIMQTGYNKEEVEKIISGFNMLGMIDNFMAEYISMAFKGRDKATDFEKATVELFINIFHMNALHTGPHGNVPDVYVWPQDNSFAGIIDNKAYADYSISNDHKNRMLYNYIPEYLNAGKNRPLTFFSYIAGGFGSNINRQLNEITKISGVSGSAITALNMVALAKAYSRKKYTPSKINELFSINRQILFSDF